MATSPPGTTVEPPSSSPSASSPQPDINELAVSAIATNDAPIFRVRLNVEGDDWVPKIMAGK
jgi:hypothetical protein